MRANKSLISKRKVSIRRKLRKMMKCVCSRDRLSVDEMNYSSESLATRDYSATASGYSSRPGENETKVDNSNIEEAESSLRESGYLNYEEARALLGRLEYQKGNIEAALHVFEGIDIAAVIPKMKMSISRRCESDNKRRPENDYAPSMSIHAVSLLLEAVFLKAKSLKTLGRFQEAAQSCKTILDTIESALPESWPENFVSDCKLQETVAKAVELLPELWSLAGSPQDVVLSFRKALLYHWNLDDEATARIQKEFALFLLYSGYEADSPPLRSQLDGSFVPRNNIEEAVLLLRILLRKSKDPSLIHHLSFALSACGEFMTLAQQVEELLPETMERRGRYYTLSLCYCGEGENMVALDLLRNFLNNKENSVNSDCIEELLLASKICADNKVCVEDGITFSSKAISQMNGKCNQMEAIANCLLGVLLSAKSKSVSSESEKVLIQSQAFSALKASEKMMEDSDPNPYIVHHLCLEYAEHRKLRIAYDHAKNLIKLEGGTSINGYILLARILSAQKKFSDAEIVIDAALEQSGKWEQGELLRTKAKIQIAQGRLKNAIETYTFLLAVLQVQNKNLGTANKAMKCKRNRDRRLEMEVWHDLTNVYTTLSQWRDAEVCLAKSEAIDPYSASRWHSTGMLYEARGLHQEALKSFKKGLDIDPNHVPSLISTACVLRKLGCQSSSSIVKSLLIEALRLDRTNSSAWYNLGLVYKDDSGTSALEAAECLEAAVFLEESCPIEPFR
ncbi:protein NPGR2-like [Vicia villosa]|uniref:protein NPGR2-like n=1 Tax=Vicia villosa TaxID=3911 RepID=UPI00273A8C59|nr:protein NPGR2-like [Vicia villosa]XP_058770778.1 protein NPGR2-like [Vicia villosa]